MLLSLTPNLKTWQVSYVPGHTGLLWLADSSYLRPWWPTGGLWKSLRDCKTSSLISGKTVLLHYRLLEQQPKTRDKFQFHDFQFGPWLLTFVEGKTELFISIYHISWLNFPNLWGQKPQGQPCSSTLSWCHFQKQNIGIYILYLWILNKPKGE